MYLTMKLILLSLIVVISACSERLPSSFQKNGPERSVEYGPYQSQIQNRITGVDDFLVTVYPLLTSHCSDCHSQAGFASPLLAYPDPAVAQAEILDNQKISFSNPANSRIVLKLRDEFHYCWNVCEEDAQQLQTAIEQWIGFVNDGGKAAVPVDIISSDFLSLVDGVLGSSTPRINDQVIALYEFKEGVGNVAKDTSGVSPPIDLTLEGTAWTAGQGIDIQSGIALGTAQASKKLYDNIAGGVNPTNEYSIEIWVIPANVTQEGPARLVTYSDGTQVRNFTMGQQNYNYVFRNRNSSPDISPNGTPALQTDNAEQVLQTNQQHVVMTYDSIAGRSIYVNGVLKSTESITANTPLNNWDPNYIFAIGNEVTNNRLFMGIVQFVAIHKAALTPEQVTQNFDAGVGEKFLLTFDISQVLGQPGNSIQFEVSEFDHFSYLFNKPVFLNTTASGLRVKNIQIAVNGQIPVAGQTWRNLDTIVTQNEQSLSTMAAVISKDAGPELDQFSVVFEILGDKQNVVIDLPPAAVQPLDVIDTAPRVGVRTFEQITHTMASITGVDPNTENIKLTYLDLKQQLPSLPNINGFLASHQVGIAKLALEYCNTLVDTTNLRDQFFGANTFDFNAPASTAFANPMQVDQLIQIMFDRMFGVNILNQPDNTLTKQELLSLIRDLTLGCNTPTQCDSVRTNTVIKASCSAMLGSAAITIQ